METTRHTLEEVLEAVEKGITRTGAAKVLGVSPVTMWRYARRWKAVEEALRHKRRELVDLAEMGLRGAVLRGESWAIAFTLKTLGRDEGYTERYEHTGAGGGELRIRVEYVDEPSERPEQGDRRRRRGRPEQREQRERERGERDERDKRSDDPPAASASRAAPDDP